MQRTICSSPGLVFGTSQDGLVSHSTNKNIRWRTFGHWETGHYVIDCRVVESHQITHQLQYTGYFTNFTPPTSLYAGTLLYCNSFSVHLARDQMVQYSLSYTENFKSDNCNVTFDGLHPTGDSCAWGLEGYFPMATYTEEIEVITFNGPTGLGGILIYEPLQGITALAGKAIKKKIQFSSETDLGNDITNISFNSAIGDCTISLSDARLVDTSIQASGTGIQVWNYTLEKEEIYSGG
jgi:hypothetical protein